MNPKRPYLAIVVAIVAAGSRALAEESAAPWANQIFGNPPQSITGNPAAESDLSGAGDLGRWLHIPDETGLRLGGVWLGDSNGLISGGAEPGKWSFNSALILGAGLDADKLIGWKGASFGIQFLQFNGENTNGQAGSVQGYNSLPGPAPLTRSELYQLWYRQSLFDDKIIFRIGKMVPTFDFNNVARPVPTQDAGLKIPAVTGLLYTPIFKNPTLIGALGGYYNSVCGIVLSVAPTKNTYLKYGLYDGNLARGVQTGMTGPQFNGYTMNIWEAGADWVIADKYPGQFGAGLWYQSGVLRAHNGVTQNGTSGFYMFGGQRIWSNNAEPAPVDGGKTKDGKSKMLIGPEKHQPASISTFFQFGVNDSQTMLFNQYFGMGFTGFGLVPHRPIDSLGVGMSWAWLNPNNFKRSSELMFQGYYQAHLFGSTFFSPAVSYIPTPGGGADLGGAWAVTFRMTVLF